MIRFEILLPLFYNDGRSVEPEKYLATDDGRGKTFGSATSRKRKRRMRRNPSLTLPARSQRGRTRSRKICHTPDDDIGRTFGATSTDQVTVRGHWKYESTVYSDQLIRVRVDVEDSEENREAMRAIKETLKSRFEQIDIWITAHRIDVI